MASKTGRKAYRLNRSLECGRDYSYRFVHFFVCIICTLMLNSISVVGLQGL
jgi:hypothetical protein